MCTATAQPVIDLSKYNGFITVHNPASGQHRTFRVRTYTKGDLAGRRAIGLLCGPDNTSSYRDFGFVNDDGRVVVWKRKRGGQFDQLAKVLNYADWYAEHRGLEFQFSTRCRKCNRDLTDPLSIELGIGPVCREMM